jgi:hypothetical protein
MHIYIYIPISGIVEFEVCQFGRGVLLKFVKTAERFVSPETFEIHFEV